MIYHNDTIDEYKRFKVERTLITMQATNTLHPRTLTVTLLNTISLPRHYFDIVGDDLLLHTDVLCLTATQIS